MPPRRVADWSAEAIASARTEATDRDPGTAAGEPSRHRAVETAIAELSSVLARERVAVVTLDAKSMGVVIEDKQALLRRLEALAHGATPAPIEPDQARSIARRLRDATTRALAQAEANGALLSDATATLAEMLGLREQATTYDARARLVQQVRAGAGKNI